LISDINEAKKLELFDVTGKKVTEPKSGYYWSKANGNISKVLVMLKK
jgi:hypothetical protein